MRRVLVADDDPSVREVLKRIFAAAEYQVEAVPDGFAAIARLRAAPFDLLVTDLRMAGVEGLELAREAKRLWPGVKVVIITGNPSQSSAIDALNIGVDGYFMKPIRAIDLLLAAERAFEPESGPARSADAGAPVQNSNLDARS